MWGRTNTSSNWAGCWATLTTSGVNLCKRCKNTDAEENRVADRMASAFQKEALRDFEESDRPTCDETVACRYKLKACRGKRSALKFRGDSPAPRHGVERQQGCHAVKQQVRVRGGSRCHPSPC